MPSLPMKPMQRLSSTTTSRLAASPALSDAFTALYIQPAGRPSSCRRLAPSTDRRSRWRVLRRARHRPSARQRHRTACGSRSSRSPRNPCLRLSVGSFPCRRFYDSVQWRMPTPRDPLLAEYAAAAADYDRRWAFYIEATTRETLARLPMRGDERVLDVGCGTGELLRRLSTQHPKARLAGVDPVADMLSVAKAKLGERTDLRVGWADGLPWDDASFDIVISCNVFHYITHPVPAL